MHTGEGALGSKHKTRQFQAAEELARSRPWRGYHFKEGQHHAPAFRQHVNLLAHWDATAQLMLCVCGKARLSFFLWRPVAPPEPFFKGTVPTSHSECVWGCVCGPERACSVVRNWELSLSRCISTFVGSFLPSSCNRFPTPHREPSICPRSGQRNREGRLERPSFFLYPPLFVAPKRPSILC